MQTVWSNSDLLSNPYQIYDVRLGMVLKKHEVTKFATRNVKDFKIVGFHKIVNPID